MKQLGLLIAILAVISATDAAGGVGFSVGGQLGLTTFNGGDPPWFTLDRMFGFSLMKKAGADWRLGLSFSRFRVSDNSSVSSEFAFNPDKRFRQRIWDGYDLALVARRPILEVGPRIYLFAGIGGGILDWKIIDAAGDTTLETTGENGETTDLAATEIFFLIDFGAVFSLSRKLFAECGLRSDYLTGLGREFAGDVEAGLGRWHLSASLGLRYMLNFGGEGSPGVNSHGGRIPFENESSVRYPKSQETNEITAKEVFSPKKDDSGDSDGDGISDADDHCPDTPPDAVGMVDIYGCPIDRDSDGWPDYKDRCPTNPIGALVDSLGCPLDNDSDGVPDGLDDCPGSEPDLPVDESGCIDISVLGGKMILNIDYRSGSYEIDQATTAKLEYVARILKKARVVTVEINGYTDNIGPAEANQALSQKRADRVRDFLVDKGIDASRLAAIGRGETDFVMSNETRAGRKKNRRIELIFGK